MGLWASHGIGYVAYSTAVGAPAARTPALPAPHPNVAVLGLPPPGGIWHEHQQMPASARAQMYLPVSDGKT